MFSPSQGSNVGCRSLFASPHSLQGAAFALGDPSAFAFASVDGHLCWQTMNADGAVNRLLLIGGGDRRKPPRGWQTAALTTEGTRSDRTDQNHFT